jgi:hypothetical protein
MFELGAEEWQLDFPVFMVRQKIIGCLMIGKIKPILSLHY